MSSFRNYLWTANFTMPRKTSVPSECSLGFSLSHLIIGKIVSHFFTSPVRRRSDFLCFRKLMHSRLCSTESILLWHLVPIMVVGMFYRLRLYIYLSFTASFYSKYPDSLLFVAFLFLSYNSSHERFELQLTL